MNKFTRFIAVVVAAVTLVVGLSASAMADTSTGTVTVNNNGTLTAVFTSGAFSFDTATVNGVAGDTVTGDVTLTIQNTEKSAAFTVSLASDGVFTNSTPEPDVAFSDNALSATAGTLTGGTNWTAVGGAVDIVSTGVVLNGTDAFLTNGSLPETISVVVPAGTADGDYTNTITVSAAFT